MSTTLSLVENLLARGRNHQLCGRDHEATSLLRQLARREDLCTQSAEEVRCQLAELALKHGRPAKARRHLAAALALSPASPRLYHLMAEAIESDPAADPRRALTYRRRAVRLEPKNADYRCAYGLLALQEGLVADGLRALSKAVKLAPDDAHILGQVAGALRQVDQLDEARRLLRAARFRNPRDARFQKLWHDFQFEILHMEQERARITRQYGEGPIVLSFARPKSRGRTFRSDGKILRRDAAEATPAPHLGRMSRRKRAL